MTLQFGTVSCGELFTFFDDLAPAETLASGIEILREVNKEAYELNFDTFAVLRVKEHPRFVITTNPDGSIHAL